MPVFLSFAVLTLIEGVVGPDLFSLTMLLVLEPVALIFCTVSMMVSSESVCFVFLPVPVIYVPIGMDQSTASISFIVLPVALVDGSINPELDSSSILLALCVPLAFIFCSILELLRRLEVTVFGVIVVLRCWLEIKLTQLISDLLNNLLSLDLSLV